MTNCTSSTYGSASAPACTLTITSSCTSRLTIAHGTWLERNDFACNIHHGPRTAAIDWEAAITALDAGELPGSAVKRMLRLAASLADQAHVSLDDAVTGIDGRNVSLLLKAIGHAAGR